MLQMDDALWNPDDDRTVIRATPLAAEVDAATAWRHTVVVVHGAEAGRRYPVEDQPLSIGRKAPATVRVPEPDVSGAHCDVQALPGRDALLVTDLQSTNGSFIDGRRVEGRALWPPGGLLQVGSHRFRHEYQPRELAQAALDADRDLQKASHYVQSLLPAPLRTPHVSAEWFFRPSARLGGDAFGYQALDEHRLAGYLIDVCGHGAGSAMHSVSVLNMLRQRALPDTDFAQPAQVLQRLNDVFPMDSHGGLYFTLWYGVFDARASTLTYGSAGHHPTYLRQPDGHPDSRQLLPLQVRNPPIGVATDLQFQQQQTAVLPGSRLYAFSDGAFEIVDKSGHPRGLQDFLPLLLEPPVSGLSEPERLFRRAGELSQSPVLDDDFSALVVTFLSS